MPASYRVGLTLALVLVAAGQARGQDAEAPRVAILVPPSLKGAKDGIFAPRSITFQLGKHGFEPGVWEKRETRIRAIRPVDRDGEGGYPAKVLVGSSFAGLKKYPSVHFIVSIKSHAFVPAAGSGGLPSNQVRYALHYRPDPKKAPVLLASYVLNLGPVDPRRDNPWTNFAQKLGDSLGDALGPKVVVGRGVVYPKRFQFAPRDPVKKLAFPTRVERDDDDQLVNSLAVKNRLPVKVRFEALDYVQPVVLSGETQAQAEQWVEFRRIEVLAPGEARVLRWRGSGPANAGHVRLRLSIGEP